MGNNNSHHAVQTAPADVVRRPPNRPQAPPSARPVSELGPRGPSYLEPENQVLPKELPSMLKLRPVSMELSKYNSDYHNLFSQKDIEPDDNDNIISMDNDESSKGDSPPRPPAPVANGHVPNTEIVKNDLAPTPVPNGHAPTQVQQNVTPQSTKNAPYRPSHRRQMSLGQEPTILEEPEETIDNRVKLDAIQQSYPGATGPSLPVKNNFNLDYTYQLTYVQLAEHRRNKTIEELEKRTGKRLSDLSADLIEHSEKPSDFIRDAPSRASSRSSGSALSSKKKKAPAPPGSACSGQTISNTKEQPYSVDNEPPIDYEIDSPRRPAQKYNSGVQNSMLPRYSFVARPHQQSPASSKQTPPPAPPPPNVAKKPGVNLARNNSFNEQPQLVLKKTPDLKPASKPNESEVGQIPWLLEIKTLSEAKAARRQQSQEASVTDESVPEVAEAKEEKNRSVEVETEAKPKLVFASSTETAETGDKDGVQEKKPLERSNSVKETEQVAAPSPKLQRHSSTTIYDRTTSPTRVQRQVSAPVETASGDPVRRLSSLLQHDIKAAANAKCLKLVKQTTPVPPKPKDPHTVFREQLEKACAARDKRAQSEGTIDEKLKRNNSNTSFEVGEVLNDEKVKARKEGTKMSETSDSLQRPPRYHKNVTVNRNANLYTKAQRGPSFTEKPVNSGVQRQVSATSLDWTPGDDLDSDDNLSDHEVTMRSGPSDGFKNTIIPNQMSDLKVSKKEKKGKKTNGTAPAEDNNKTKFGSVKKFKKSMRKGVKNAFGSISKASGKILKRQRAAEIEMVEDAPKNWSLTANNGGHNISRAQRYQVPNDDERDDLTDSDSENLSHENEYSEMAFEQNGFVDDRESSEEEDEAEIDVKQYRKSRVKDKKKKAYEGKKTRDAEYYRTQETQRRIEEEKRKQLEMELEMHKIREAETRERLQRLEAAHLQQQLTAQLLQQQQQQQQQHQPQNMGLLPASHLPPSSGTYGTYGTLPDTSQAPNYASLFNQQMPQNGFPTNYGLYSQTNPYMNSSIPGMSYDLNDYMRMLGLQNPPTSQQMAFFLSNMTMTGQPFDKKSNPLLFNMYNQQYPTGNLGYQGMDSGSLKKQGFQAWASSPNIHNVSGDQNTGVPIGDFVSSYNGANNNKGVKEESLEKNIKAKSCNPLYDSDNSDEGLSPQKSVARVQVKDYRPLPVRTESGKFMRKYASENFVSQTGVKIEDSVDMTKSDTNFSENGTDIQFRRQHSVSPTNSVSTVDSAITTSPSVTISTPSSPAQSVGAPASPMLTGKASRGSHSGFKTVVDLSSPNGSTTQIVINDGDAVRF